jgi:predicted DNA-binding transcriptional regulator AlpA
MAAPDQFERLVTHWPSALVARTEVARFTGGILSGKTLANLASRGEKVPPSIRIGQKIAYDATALAEWLRNRSERRRE